MSITLNQAKNLKYGDVLHHTTNKNADGAPQRWRVNGQARRWKRDPNRIKVPLKHGLYNHGYLTEADLDIVTMED